MTTAACRAPRSTALPCRLCWPMSGPAGSPTVVVYKVDRLTRSLADFAKLVELFDEHGVSFVSVTQQFNTTASMGRLTLNVLLSLMAHRTRSALEFDRAIARSGIDCLPKASLPSFVRD